MDFWTGLYIADIRRYSNEEKCSKYRWLFPFEKLVQWKEGQISLSLLFFFNNCKTELTVILVAEIIIFQSVIAICRSSFKTLLMPIPAIFLHSKYLPHSGCTSLSMRNTLLHEDMQIIQFGREEAISSI